MLLGIYAWYVKGHFEADASVDAADLAPLRFRRLDRRGLRQDPQVPRLRAVNLQVLAALAFIVIGAVFFVNAVEDLAVRGLARTRLAKSVHDAGWSAFVHMLEYKAGLYGRTFHRIGRFEPTSQVCSACGIKDGPKPLYLRAWQCQGCGAWLDRDVNAAVNVAKAAGLAVTACGAQVRPESALAQRSEAGTHPRPRRVAA